MKLIVLTVCLMLLLPSTIVLAQETTVSTEEVIESEENVILSFFDWLFSIPGRFIFAFVGEEAEPIVCGDGYCHEEHGENYENCPQDCNAPAFCGDNSCNEYESDENCPQDCPTAICGDSYCLHYESAESCPYDCAPRCGNGDCELAPNMEDPDCACRPTHLVIHDVGKNSTEFIWPNLDPEDPGYINPEYINSQQCIDELGAEVWATANGRCVLSGGETVFNCPQDCDNPYAQLCGDGICNTVGQDCPEDCE